MGKNNHDHDIDVKRWWERSINSIPFSVQFESVPITFSTDYVKGIYVDEIEKVVSVRFKDGTNEVVRCSKDDEFDVSVGTAIAIARKIFGNPTRFYKKVVAKKTHYVKRAEPNEFDIYTKWCKENHKRLVSEATFKKNKAMYLKKMKGDK